VNINFNVFYSTFTSVGHIFIIIVTFLTFFNVLFKILTSTFFHIYTLWWNTITVTQRSRDHRDHKSWASTIYWHTPVGAGPQCVFVL